MNIRIETGDSVEEIDIDLNLENMTLLESVRLEEALGDTVFEKLMAGQLDELQMSKPSYVQAIIWAKLATIYPDVPRSGFDMDVDELQKLRTSEAPAIPKAGDGSNP